MKELMGIIVIACVFTIAWRSTENETIQRNIINGKDFKISTGKEYRCFKTSKQIVLDLLQEEIERVEHDKTK